ncbi:hypothetical protein DIPPA_08337 [Diplonema papillatum]|nr:hypothetical protein DIPPA_08337 [Diplonema papillatum]
MLGEPLNPADNADGSYLYSAAGYQTGTNLTMRASHSRPTTDDPAAQRTPPPSAARDNCVTWKRAAGVLAFTLVCLLIVFGFLVWTYNIRSCKVYLNDFTLLSLPKQSTPAENLELPVQLWVSVYNPTSTRGSLKRASFRVSFIDYQNGGVAYGADNQILFPGETSCPAGNPSASLSARSWTDEFFCTNLTLASGGGNVRTLLTHGCFAVEVTGDMSYEVGTRSHSTSLYRRFQLYQDAACPCPST